MSLFRKAASVGTLGVVGWNGQRATRAKNQKAQAKLARAEAGALKARTAADVRAQQKITNAQVRAIKHQAPAAVVPTVQMATPAAWHPDPHGQHRLRYWDGTHWTDHVSD